MQRRRRWRGRLRRPLVQSRRRGSEVDPHGAATPAMPRATLVASRAWSSRCTASRDRMPDRQRRSRAAPIPRCDTITRHSPANPRLRWDERAIHLGALDLRRLLRCGPCKPTSPASAARKAAVSAILRMVPPDTASRASFSGRSACGRASAPERSAARSPPAAWRRGKETARCAQPAQEGRVQRLLIVGGRGSRGRDSSPSAASRKLTSILA